MQKLRRRIPFKVVEDDEDRSVLDEQQQEAIIDDLRKENDGLNKGHFLALKVLVGLSTALQVIGISRNPLLTIYPVSSQEPDALPLPAIFTLLSLFIHTNFALFFLSEPVRAFLQLDIPPTPISFQMLYCISAVAPTFSFIHGKPWQTTVWWCITPFMVFVVQTVVDMIQTSSDDVAQLETMKYTAPGA